MILLTLFALGDVCSNDFVNYDDDVYVSKNFNVLGGLTLETIAWAFTTTRSNHWHPLTWLSLQVDADLWGPGPWGFHFTNLLLHLANVLLLYGLLCRMTGAVWSSALVAALFAVHPLHVESVAWVTERKDVLSTFFWLLAILAYVRYVRQPAWRRYRWVMVFFAFGLLAKPMVMTLPFVLLLLDHWPLRRSSLPFVRLVVEKLPLLLLSLLSGLVSLSARAAGGGLKSGQYLGLGSGSATPSQPTRAISTSSSGP